MGLFADERVEVPTKTYATRSKDTSIGNRKDPLANQILIIMFGLSSTLYPCLANKNDVFTSLLKELTTTWTDIFCPC